MKIQLTGKKAIISGSTTGIGYAIARELAAAGAAVLLSGRTDIRINEAVDRLQRELPGAWVEGCAADLSTAAGVERLTAVWPQADILVNNLGIQEPRPFFEIDDLEWERYFQTNVMSAVRLSRYYARGMAERGWGRVICNASAVAGFFSGEMVHFGATKAAVLALSRGLAESLAGSGVTVNAFLPGPTRTEGVGDFVNNLAQAAGKTAAQTEAEMFSTGLPTSLLQRFITPAEVAALVVFLASDPAAAITGAALRVDGGIMRTIL